MTQKIRALLIIEVAGRPPEYLKEALVSHINLLKEYKEVRLISSSPSEPRKIEDAQDMYSCFSEVEIEADNFLKLCDVVFDFMPSSVEIISPSELAFNLSDATIVLNTLAGRLHKFEDLARLAQIQAQQAIMKAKESPVQPAKKPGITFNTNVLPSEDKVEKKSEIKAKNKDKKKKK